MKSLNLATSLPHEAITAALEWVRSHGALTEPLLRRAMRDSAIIVGLRSGLDYEAVGARFGVSVDTVRDVEEAYRKIQRTM